MAELTKKLHFKKNTTEHMAKAYSTTAEAGAEYITNKIDGVTAYVPVGAIENPEATLGRVVKNGTKAILKSGKIPYGEQRWTTAGVYSFTVPQGVKRLRVALCGGGSAALAVDQRRNKDYEDMPGTLWVKWVGKKGNDSSFGDLRATGGGEVSLVGGGDSGTTHTAKGGTPNGKDGISPREAFLGEGGGTLTLPENGFDIIFKKQKGEYGKAGEFSWRRYNLDNGVYIGGTGATGGFYSGYLDVKGGETFKVVVGGKSLDNDFKPNDEITFIKPTDGFVLVAYGGYIENA